MQIPVVATQEAQVEQGLQATEPSTLQVFSGQAEQLVPEICWPEGQETQRPVKELQV